MTTENNNQNFDNTETSAHDSATTDAAPQRSAVGPWARRVGRIVGERFEAAFAHEGISRREWMILNVLDGKTVRPELAERVQRGGKKVQALAERGWVAETDGAWSLTDDGRAAKARIGASISGIRSRLTGAVSADDLATTAASLEAIARAFGWDESSREHRPRGGGRRGGLGMRGQHRGMPGRHGLRGENGMPGDHCGHRGERPEPRGAHGGHMHPGHDHRQAHRAAERAYERGFDAGFARGERNA